MKFEAQTIAHSANCFFRVYYVRVPRHDFRGRVYPARVTLGGRVWVDDKIVHEWIDRALLHEVISQSVK